MKTLERLVQRIAGGQWLALEELDQRVGPVEARHGFPARRRYRRATGDLSENVLVIEREWESLAAFEAAYEALWRDPDYPTAAADFQTIVIHNTLELYMILT